MNKRIITAGRLEYEKGFDRIIDVFNDKYIKSSGWRLDIYGDGSQKDNLINKIKELNLEDKVRILPFTKNIKEEFLKSVEKYIKEFYGDNPIDSEDYVKIINQRHFQRILSLVSEENIILGGKYDEPKLKIEPTVVEVKSLDEKIMGEEIFGPIMPIITYSKYEEIINIVRSFEKPLALYLFTEDKKLEDRIIKDINFGGGCINDTIVHLATTELPFGGVGMSGMGSYHGKKSFDTFTHEKSILKRSNFIDIPLRYPPYLGKISLLRKIFK